MQIPCPDDHDNDNGGEDALTQDDDGPQRNNPCEGVRYRQYFAEIHF